MLWIGDRRLAPVWPRWHDVVLARARRLRIANAASVFVACSPPALARALARAELPARGWEAFRRYLTDFPRLQEAPPATLELWERYLVYGIAFGIAERVLQGAQLHMPEALHAAARSTGSRRAAISARAERALDRRPLVRLSARPSLLADLRRRGGGGGGFSGGGRWRRRAGGGGWRRLGDGGIGRLRAPARASYVEARSRPATPRDVERSSAPAARTAGSSPAYEPVVSAPRRPSRSEPSSSVSRGASVDLGERRAAVRDEGDARRAARPQWRRRHAEDRARGGAQRLRPERIGAARRRARPPRRTPSAVRAACRRSRDRTVRQSPSDHVGASRRQVARAVDPDRASAGAAASETGASSSGATVSPATSSSTGSMRPRSRRLDEILALGDEQPGLERGASSRQPADELERGVVRGRDHGAGPSRARRRGSRRGRANSRSAPASR
jgi:hypothetical protein